MSNGILQGLRVLDFTWVLAGPYATRILADFGVEVIKVQSGKTAGGAELNTTPYFNMWNRNKLSINLDLSQPGGRELALKLVGISDVVMENFTPRVMSNWGLNYECLKRIKPEIIMVSMSGMGQTGPWRDSAAFAATIQALSGVTYLTSFSDQHPLGLGYAYADHVAGLYATFAVLAALEQRDQTGEGQYIDISEYEVMCTMLGPAIMDRASNCESVGPRGNNPDHVLAAPYGCYKCQGDDRWCVIAINTEEEWESLCHALGDPLWVRDYKFATACSRREHSEELDALIEQWTMQQSPEQVMSLLQKAGIAAAVVNSAEDLARDPHLTARGFFVQGSHPLLGDVMLDSTPVRLSRIPAQIRRVAPLLGQDNRYVFQELLGMSDTELSQYVKAGAIR